MMNMKNRRALTSLVVAVTGWTIVAQAAYVITPQGTRIEGRDIRAKANGEIILQTDAGTRTFYKGQYSRAVADKPENFDRARQMIDAGKFDEAVTILEKIVRDYVYLEWDNQARALLPRAYSGKGDFGAAAAAYEELFKAAPASTENPDMVWSYREALLKAGSYSKLEPMLARDIKEGTLTEAAKAQIMRGDIRMAQGLTEPAAMDYLRTVILFEKEKDVQPEALFKAGVALEQLRDRRYKEMYQRLVSDYPTSPYASEARGKL